jgi:hypothetical protein
MIFFSEKILPTFKGKKLKNKDGFVLWEKNYPWLRKKSWK